MYKTAVIIGAQRSGTTYLYRILDRHPEICCAKPVKPEPKFFLDENFRNDKSLYFNTFYSHRNNSEKIFIEKSTSYYEYENAIKNILRFDKNVKLIFMLRNPVDRALSNYFFSKNNGIENRTLEEVFIKNKETPVLKKNISVNPFDYLKRGEYSHNLKMILKYISEENIKIIKSEDFFGNSAEIKSLYKFLGVDERYLPDIINEPVNSSKKEEFVPLGIRNLLEQYYKFFNKELEEITGKRFF